MPRGRCCQAQQLLWLGLTLGHFEQMLAQNCASLGKARPRLGSKPCFLGLVLFCCELSFPNVQWRHQENYDQGCLGIGLFSSKHLAWLSLSFANLMSKIPAKIKAWYARLIGPRKKVSGWGTKAHNKCTRRILGKACSFTFEAVLFQQCCFVDLKWRS